MRNEAVWKDGSSMGVILGASLFRAEGVAVEILMRGMSFKHCRGLTTSRRLSLIFLGVPLAQDGG